MNALLHIARLEKRIGARELFALDDFALEHATAYVVPERKPLFALWRIGDRIERRLYGKLAAFSVGHGIARGGSCFRANLRCGSGAGGLWKFIFGHGEIR